MEGFRLAGFRVAGVYDEPSAAGIEYAHRYRGKDLTRKRENLLVYDLGGGTFDCSVIRLTGDDHSVITSSGIGKLGGDDFDAVLLEMAEAASLPDQDRLLEICRLAKERLNPNSRRILLDLGEYEAAIPVDDFYARCAAPIDRTIDVVDSVITKVGGVETLSCIYIVGGGSEFPPVARVLRTRFGRRVRKSSYAHAATAIGLAITADMRSEMRIERTFTRNFGVWREAESGASAFFDTLFPRVVACPHTAFDAIIRHTISDTFAISNAMKLTSRTGRPAILLHGMTSSFPLSRNCAKVRPPQLFGFQTRLHPRSSRKSMLVMRTVS